MKQKIFNFIKKWVIHLVPSFIGVVLTITIPERIAEIRMGCEIDRSFLELVYDNYIVWPIGLMWPLIVIIVEAAEWANTKMPEKYDPQKTKLAEWFDKHFLKIMIPLFILIAVLNYLGVKC